MLKLLEEHLPKLILGKGRVHQSDGYTVEGEVPCGEPGILPLITDRHYAHRVEMPPMRVSILQARSRRRRVGIIAGKPGFHVKDVILLGPEQTGQRLPLNESLIGARM